jgi:prophage DNA circulation protein
MKKTDAQEAVPICKTVLGTVLSSVATRGRPGSDLRTAVNDFLADAQTIIQHDESGPVLADIFNKAIAAGMTLAQMEHVRRVAADQAPKTLGARLVQNGLIRFALSASGTILANTTFVSRQDVTATQNSMNDAFAAMEEIAADDMDQMGYQLTVALHAAVTFYLIETGRPLPRVVNFQFAASKPTIVTSYRLYATAGRGDELRDENKVVHPAFMKPFGIALSA